MLVKLGARTSDGDVVDLLIECHERIRRFLAIAGRLLDADAGATERRDAAAQVHRYFTQAFPLHLADEDELIAPLLAGRTSELDAALATMRGDHVDHATAIDRLVHALADVIARPDQRANDAALRAAIDDANHALEPHLILEEREIFPRLRDLPASTRAEIRAGMRDRRAIRA